MEDLISGFSGLLIDAFLKLWNPKIDWGFSYKKKPVLCFLAGFSLIMIPIGIHNDFAFKYLLIFVAIFFFFALLIYLFYVDLPKPKKEEIIHYNDNDILDDEFTKK